MQETLKRICSLQSQYSSSNTPEMQERGSLIRGALTQAISARLPRLQMAFDGVFDDLAWLVLTELVVRLRLHGFDFFRKQCHPTLEKAFTLYYISPLMDPVFLLPLDAEVPFGVQVTLDRFRMKSCSGAPLGQDL